MTNPHVLDHQRPHAGAEGRLYRPARALLGWMTPDTAHRALLSNRADRQIGEAEIARAAQTRSAVASRPPGIDQADVVAEVPAELGGHVTALQQATTAAPFFAEGWSVRLVHLDRIIAFQPTVFSACPTFDEWDHRRRFAARPGSCHIELPFDACRFQPEDTGAAAA
jgi:hypothetical protein